MSKIFLLKPTTTTTSSSSIGLTALTQVRTLSTFLRRKRPLLLSPPQSSTPIFSPGPHPLLSRITTPSFPIRALNSPPTKEEEEEEKGSDEKSKETGADGPLPGSGPKTVKDEEYPSGEFEMVKFGWWVSFLVKLRMLFALPWERVKKGSVLSIKLKGEVLILTHFA